MPVRAPPRCRRPRPRDVATPARAAAAGWRSRWWLLPLYYVDETPDDADPRPARSLRVSLAALVVPAPGDPGPGGDALGVAPAAAADVGRRGPRGAAPARRAPRPRP